MEDLYLNLFIFTFATIAALHGLGLKLGIVRELLQLIVADFRHG